MKIAAVARAGTGAPPATPGTASLTGAVTGTDIAGNAIVRTNTAELILPTPRPLPVGSNLLLEVTGRLSSPADRGLPPHALALSQRWEALQDALRATPTAQPTVAQAIPQPGPQFTGALLFFIAALRAGDLRGWLGPDAARAVDREGLLSRLTEEFGAMQRIASEPGGQDWRLFLLPVLSDEQLHQMRLFVRDNRDSAATDDKERETRFVIEVTFTKLGAFQFDGLARPKALDLVIRTERALPPGMRTEIAELFSDTTAALGLRGSVAFRTEAFFEIQPLRDSGLMRDAGLLA